MADTVVVDASVAAKWLVNESDSEAALDILKTRDLIAPSLLRTEVANILWKYVQRNLLATEAALQLFRDFEFLMEGTFEDTDLHETALAMACALNHPVYDCVYLASALNAGVPLATADRKLAALSRRPGYGGPEILLIGAPLA